MPAARPNMELTTTERLGLSKYNALCDRLGAAPSVRALAREMGLSHNGAHLVIKSLVKKGHLTERKTITTELRLSAKGKREL